MALADLYGPLLTERQRDILRRYYHDDLSLGEIAAEEGISRQAVHDLLRRGLAALRTYERRLGLAARQGRRDEAARELSAALRRVEEAGGPTLREPMAAVRRWLAEMTADPAGDAP